ncbi:hypothetical protein MMC09_003964 [Bachmanniomyces sp. S44760]|nr:hypothetical protein [Bachmanniomyces sp. S44760]
MAQQREKIAELRAIESISDIRCHQSFILPPNADAGRPTPIRVTYSDYDHRDPTKRQDGPVLLLIGGLFGGRYMFRGANAPLVEQHQIRLLCIDKCGLGGTGGVPLEFRMKTWLDIVPALLKHLGIKHVALASHCAGTMYLLNTLLHRRHLLHPFRPYVALLAPWVHPSKSKKTAMTLSNIFPKGAISSFGSVSKFVSTNVMPVATFSGGILNSVMRSKSKDSASKPSDPETDAFNSATISLVMKYLFAENVEGGGQEALLCLKRGSKNLWGTWEDYDELVPMLAKQETDLISKHRPGTAEKLKVQAYFAENDMMIGKKGSAWFDECWKITNISECISYTSKTVPDSTHDDILELDQGIMNEVFEQVVCSFEDHGRVSEVLGCTE